MSTSTLVIADDDDEDHFEEAFVYFELNDTDGDLGIHGKIDGEAWKKMEIEDPYERRMLKVKASGRLKRQGMTELFFESAEPCFNFDPEECPNPLDTDKFFDRFPESATKLFYTITFTKNWKHQPRIVAFREWLHKEAGPRSQLDGSVDWLRAKAGTDNLTI